MSGPHRAKDGRWRLPASECPECAHRLDGASNTMGEDAKPDPDDLTVCIYCGAVLQFDGELKLVPATAGNLMQARREMPEAVKEMERVSAAAMALRMRDGRA